MSERKNTSSLVCVRSVCESAVSSAGFASSTQVHSSPKRPFPAWWCALAICLCAASLQAAVMYEWVGGRPGFSGQILLDSSHSPIGGGTPDDILWAHIHTPDFDVTYDRSLRVADPDGGYHYYLTYHGINYYAAFHPGQFYWNSERIFKMYLTLSDGHGHWLGLGANDPYKGAWNWMYASPDFSYDFSRDAGGAWVAAVPEPAGAGRGAMAALLLFLGFQGVLSYRKRKAARTAS